MDRNRIAIDGAVTIRAMMMLAWQGFLIKLGFGLGFAVILTSIAAFYLKSPEDINLTIINDEIEQVTDIKVGSADSVQRILNQYAYSGLFKPPKALENPVDKATGQRFWSNEDFSKITSGFTAAEKKFWHQYYKYAYVFLGGFILGFVGMSIWARKEAKKRSEDQYIRGSQLNTEKELAHCCPIV